MDSIMDSIGTNFSGAAKGYINNNGGGANNVRTNEHFNESLKVSNGTETIVPDIKNMDEECLKSLQELHISKFSDTQSPSSRLFDTRLPSALKVTNPETAKNVLSQQVKKGWRWVTKDPLPADFSNPKVGCSTNYRIIECAEFNPIDLNKADMVMIKDQKHIVEDKLPLYYLNNWNAVHKSSYRSAWDPPTLTKYMFKCHPVLRARQMPELKEGDWVVMEGKTMRLVPVSSMDDSDRKLSKKLEQELAGKSSSRVEESEFTALFVDDIPDDFFNDSYARLQGASIRHLERLSKLQEAFNRFFDITECPVPPFKAGLYERDAKEFDLLAIKSNKWGFVKLKNDLIRENDLLLIHQALGIDIRPETLNEHSTVENTIPFKKVLEMLTCFDPQKYADCPWYISFNILNEKKGFFFLLSRGQMTEYQLMLSTLQPSGNFVGHAYPYWMDGRVSAEEILKILNKTISQAREFIADLDRKVVDWQKILEFVVCAQVVESHCTPGQLAKSRVPGAGKQARAIFKYCSEKELPYTQSFDFSFGDLPEGQRMFPMVGEGGTGNTRNAVNSLTRPEGKAPCYDMSEDSAVEELHEDSNVSGEGMRS